MTRHFKLWAQSELKSTSNDPSILADSTDVGGLDFPYLGYRDSFFGSLFGDQPVTNHGGDQLRDLLGIFGQVHSSLDKKRNGHV